MDLAFTEAQMLAAGFTAPVPELPHALRSYEKLLGNGNTLTISRPAKEKARHFAVEFCGRMPVNHYWLTTPEHLTQLTNGQLAPVQFGK